MHGPREKEKERKKNTQTKKTTSTHSEFVILLAFPLQQWSHECASVLIISTLIAFLVKYDT
jgi:hypothetical protein